MLNFNNSDQGGAKKLMRDLSAYNHSTYGREWSRI